MLDFSPLNAEVTPERIKAELMARLSASGLEIDTREGSYTDLIYAEAAYQIYKAWQQLRVLLAAAVPGPDSGPYLDYFGGQYGMVRTPAATAHAVLTFRGENGAAVPAGTVCLTGSGLRFTTDTRATVSGGTAEVPATAEAAGEIYNVPSGTVTRFLVTMPGVESVTNADPAQGGADAESDTSYYERIHTRLSKPVASGNMYYYEQLARQTPGVGQAKTIPLWNGPGTVKVVVASADKQPVDGLIVTQAQQLLDEGRVIGAEVTAVSAAALKVTVAATCTLEGGVLPAAVEAQLATQLREMFETMEFGTDAPIRLNQVALRLLSCDGVVDYTQLKINGKAANLAKTVEQVPVLQTVTITQG
mgnify:CR=1 FL=1|nr:baseplate J/gp47 family protein [uncultured Flavonifractor sp.]